MSLTPIDLRAVFQCAVELAGATNAYHPDDHPDVSDDDPERLDRTVRWHDALDAIEVAANRIKRATGATGPLDAGDFLETKAEPAWEAFSSQFKYISHPLTVRRALLKVANAAIDLSGYACLREPDPLMRERGMRLLQWGVAQLWSGMADGDCNAMRPLLAECARSLGWPSGPNAVPPPYAGPDDIPIEDHYRVIDISRGFFARGAGYLRSLQERLARSAPAEQPLARTESPPQPTNETETARPDLPALVESLRDETRSEAARHAAETALIEQAHRRVRRLWAEFGAGGHAFVWTWLERRPNWGKPVEIDFPALCRDWASALLRVRAVIQEDGWKDAVRRLCSDVHARPTDDRRVLTMLLLCAESGLDAAGISTQMQEFVSVDQALMIASDWQRLPAKIEEEERQAAPPPPLAPLPDDEARRLPPVDGIVFGYGGEATRRRLCAEWRSGGGSTVRCRWIDDGGRLALGDVELWRGAWVDADRIGSGIVPWLPDGWGIELFPLGWTAAHVLQWFNYAIGLAETDCGATRRTKDDRSPRQLVYHADLIADRLLVGRVPEPIPQGKLDCVQRLRTLRAMLERDGWPDEPAGVDLESGAGSGTPLIQVEQWSDLAIGINERWEYWALTPPPHFGADFPVRQATRLALPGKRWKELLQLAALSPDGRTVSRSELATALNFTRHRSDARIDTRARQGAIHGAQAQENGLTVKRGRIERQLQTTLGDLRRKLRRLVRGPKERPGEPLTLLVLGDDSVDLGFTVQHLVQDQSRRVRFGTRSDG